MLFSTLLVVLLLASSNSSVVNLTENSQNQEADSYDADSEAASFEEAGVDLQQLIQQTPQAEEASESGSNGTYELIWEPNRIQGSVHSVAVYGTIVAIGAGYLYDNVIHIYRWNPSISGEAGLTHVGDSGDGLFQSDVLSLVFGDTDKDGYVEIVAGCADGQVYVFEQRATSSADTLYYDFQLVWNSPVGEIGKRVASVTVDDLDSDGLREIIAGAWTQKIYVYEYTERYGTSGASNHCHYYSMVWNSSDLIKGLVNSVVVGDTDADSFREVIAGASDNKVYIFENEEDTSPEPVYPHVDNGYSEIWNSTDRILGPVQMVALDNSIDEDEYGEIVAVSSGHGAFAFDYAPLLGDYVMSKLMRAVEPWERNPPFPIDSYVDVKTWGNSVTHGVFEPGQRTGPNDPRGSIPLPYGDLGANATAMAGPPDRQMWEPFYNVTLLDATAASDGVARAVLDFGKDEELTGGGNSLGDVFVLGFEVVPKNVTVDNFSMYVSQDGANFSRVDEGLVIAKGAPYDYHGTWIRVVLMGVDIDPTLNALGWEWFRYIKLETTTQVYIDAIGGLYLYRPVADALSVSLGFVLGLNTTSTDYTSKIIIGTSTGVLKAFSRIGGYYVQTWDSYRPIPLYQPGTELYRRRFSMNNNIWSTSLASQYLGFFLLRRYIVVGTYPKVAFIHVNATTLEASSVWDTGNVLARWTMTVDLEDTDGDGAEEVVVGSFDNNIYVFDHVYRNTYRRAWRSPDLKHNQTYWDHVTDLIVGDYDADGKLELIASTNNQTYPIIHIFENTAKNQFAASEIIEMPKNSGPITALDLGDDLDNDEAKEIVVATMKNVTIFEKKDGSIAKSSSLEVVSAAWGGVLALVTGDTDSDGRGEIIVGGWIHTPPIGPPILYGFVSVYENTGTDNTYQLVWYPPSTHMYHDDSFEVLSLALDDQDNDTKTEIIVGHSLGVNVYENTGNNSFEAIHFVTSSASYPDYTPTQVLSLSDTYCPAPFNSWEGWRLSAAPVVQLSNGTYVWVYTSIDSTIDKTRMYWNESRVFYRTSQDGISWSSRKRATSDAQYSPTEWYWLYYERNPSVVVTPTDQVWIAYEAKFVSTSFEFPAIEPYLWICVTKLGTTRPDLDFSKISNSYKTVSPSIFWNSTASTLGLTYLNYTAPFSGLNMLYLSKSHWVLYVISWVPLKVYAYPVWETPQLQNSKIGAEFRAYSQGTAFLSDGSLAVVFAGYNRTQIPSRDSDIWFMRTNASGSLEWSDPTWISLSQDYEYTPSMTILNGDVLAVVFRRSIWLGLNNYWDVYITASRDDGWSWTTPQELPKTTGYAYAPSVSRLVNGGFLYTFHTSTSTSLPTSPKICFAQNPVEYWWRYNISLVQSLAVGDTDGNQISEIIAGSLYQIYILELADIGNGNFNYTQKWVSQALPQLITDIAIGDINNDGTNEIVVAAESGNLYAFRWKKQE